MNDEGFDITAVNQYLLLAGVFFTPTNGTMQNRLEK